MKDSEPSIIDWTKPASGSSFIWGTIIVFGVTLLYAFTFMKGWGWFLVPAGMPPVSYRTALGVVLCAHALQQGRLSTFPDSLKEPRAREMGQRLFFFVMRPLWILAIMFVLGRFF